MWLKTANSFFCHSYWERESQDNVQYKQGFNKMGILILMIELKTGKK